jgi:predicted kinase
MHTVGVNCILEATFNTEESRRTAIGKSASVSSEQIYMAECVCSENIVTSRLKARKVDFSDANI